MSVDASRRARLAQYTRELLALRIEDTDDVDGIMQYNQAVASSLAAKGSTWPHYEAYRPSLREALRLNHLQNNLRLLVAQTRAIDVVPQWTNTQDDLMSLARSEWWKWHSQGMDGLGGWKTDVDNAFSDFAALGEGYLRAGVIDAEKGQTITVTHYHPLNVLMDPYAKYTNESRWVAFSTIYGKEEAEDRFPEFDFDEYQASVYQRMGVMLQGVRIIEYFGRKSLSDDEPSYLAMAGHLSGPVMKESDNPFGDVLPYQSFLGFIPSGSDIPVGMVHLSVYVQRELDRIDQDAKKKSQRDNLLGLPPDAFNKDDLQSYADGNRPEFLRLDESYLTRFPDVQKQIVTVPRNGENEDQKQRRAELMSLLQQLSGVSTLDMGVLSEHDNTATEINQVAARGSQQVSNYSREFSRGIAELAVKVGTLARQYDTAPFCMNMDGVPVWWNSKDNRLTSKVLFDGALNVVIGDEDLIMTDVNAKRQREGAKWLSIYNVSQSPEAWRQYLLSQGIKNPEDYMPQQPAMPQMGAQPGQMPITGA